MMEYKGYHADISYSDDDNIFVGQVIGINDVLCFHGSSIEELKQMFHQSIDNYLDMCKEIGKQPEKEYKGCFQVRIPAQLHKDAALYAEQKHMSLNMFVKNAIEHECNKVAIES